MTLSQVSFPLPLLLWVPPLTQMQPHTRAVAISLGSPALAAYSPALTSLNTRLVYRRAQHIKHESSNTVARALVSLQQIPLELTRDERLLAFIPVNEQWQREIGDRLNRRYVWPVAVGSSVTWVVIAFIFTLVDSFIDIDVSSDGGGRVMRLVPSGCGSCAWLLAGYGFQRSPVVNRIPPSPPARTREQPRKRPKE